MRYDELLAAGTRLVAIDIDSPGQHAAMVDKLGYNLASVGFPETRSDKASMARTMTIS